MKIRYGTIAAVLLVIASWLTLIMGGETTVAYLLGITAVVAAVFGTLEK